MATICKRDALSAGLDELTIDKLMDNIKISSKSSREIVEELVEEQRHINFFENSNRTNAARHERFITMARITADSTVRPFRKMWKFFFDDKDSVGVRITTRHQRTLADIQAEGDIATHDIFTLIEGHMVTRKQDLIFREDFITEMMSEATTQQSRNKTAFRLATAVKRQQALQVAESRAYGSGLYHKPGWVTSQFHDPLRIKAATKETWVDDIIGNLEKYSSLGMLKMEADMYFKHLRSVFELYQRWLNDGTVLTIEDAEKELLSYGGSNHMKYGEAREWCGLSNSYESFK